MGERKCFFKRRRRKAMTDRQEDLSVGADQKVINQMAEIFSQLKTKSLTPDHLQALIDHKNPFEVKKYPDWQFILMLLGRDKVITAERSAGVWGLEPPKDDKVLYSKATLRHAAEENRQGKSDWRLIYINGLSLREQREKRGVDKSKQPCFSDNDWRLLKGGDEWAAFKPQAGYYLINFREEQFANMKWNKQEEEISKLGSGYERCHETIFAEAIQTIFMVSNERIAAVWWHRGVSATLDKSHIVVGYFFSDGLVVGSHKDDYYIGDCCAAVVRRAGF
jgi:hypothetical protein